MKTKCVICGKRVKIRRDGWLYAHVVFGVPCHGSQLRCPECGKGQITNNLDGSNHEEGCQIGCEEQQNITEKYS